jgi:hypothetical protein
MEKIQHSDWMSMDSFSTPVMSFFHHGSPVTSDLSNFSVSCCWELDNMCVCCPDEGINTATDERKQSTDEIKHTIDQRKHSIDEG